MNAEKRFSIQVPSMQAFLTASIGSILVGCSMMPHLQSHAQATAERHRVVRLERQLKKARGQVESLRERNWVLKSRINRERDEDYEFDRAPAVASASDDRLRAFAPGQIVDPSRIEASMARPARRTGAVRPREVSAPNVSLATNLPPAGLLTPAVQPAVESADRVLAKSVLDLLKSGDEGEAERMAGLLEKSYPDSDLVAETRFQQGLYFYRKKNLAQADLHFVAALKAPHAQVRARAGAGLMRGIIAGRLAIEPRVTQVAAVTNRTLSRKSFEYVRRTFPGTPEARRATRELTALRAEMRVR